MRILQASEIVFVGGGSEVANATNTTNATKFTNIKAILKGKRGADAWQCDCYCQDGWGNVYRKGWAGGYGDCANMCYPADVWACRYPPNKEKNKT